MSSKAFVFLAFLLAIVVLISSEVAARDLDVEKKTETNGVEDSKYGGYDRGGYDHGGYGRGGYGRGGYGRGGYGRGGGGYGRGGGGYGGGHCRYGGCGGRCCNYAGEVVEAEPQVKPHN